MTVTHAVQILERALASGGPLLDRYELEALRVLLAASGGSKPRSYRFHWRDGRSEELRGAGPGDAMTSAGYSIEDLDQLADIEVMTG